MKANVETEPSKRESINTRILAETALIPNGLKTGAIIPHAVARLK
jgi:hypothetical protein